MKGLGIRLRFLNNSTKNYNKNTMIYKSWNKILYNFILQSQNTNTNNRNQQHAINKFRF